MNMIRARPTTPTIVKTRPEATLFCKKDELPVFELILGGVAFGDDCTVTVEVCTVTGGSEIALIEAFVGDATGADKVVELELLDGNVPVVLRPCQPCILRHRYWKTYEDALSDVEVFEVLHT